MAGSSVRRFPILFAGANRAMVLLGIRPQHSSVEVSDELLVVRMSWAFSLDAPRAAIKHVALDHDPVWGWGVHGWRGEWLVNGSSRNLVRIELSPPVRARMLVFAVRVRTLRVSVAEPEALVASLSSA